MKQTFSTGSKHFLTTVIENEREKFIPFLKNFEMSCILSEFDEAVLAIPFDTEEYKEGLERVYKYVRQVVLSKLSQKLLANSYSKDDKNSQESLNLLINRLSSEDSNGDLNSAKKIVFELQE